MFYSKKKEDPSPRMNSFPFVRWVMREKLLCEEVQEKIHCHAGDARFYVGDLIHKRY